MHVFRVRNSRVFVLKIIIFIIGFIAVNFLLQAGISCVDNHGCLKEFCKEEWLKREYRQILQENAETCRNFRGF